MTVTELIEALKQMPQDAQVYSYTDHGQTFEQSQSPSIMYADEVEYTLEGAYSQEEVEEYGIEDAFQVVVL